MLSVANLCYSYGSVQALGAIDMQVERRAITCVIGRNGVGKTTLMKALMGVLTPDAGAIQLDGRDVARWPAHRRARAGLGLVPQGRHIFAKLTVEENLRIGLQARTDGKRQIPEHVYELFPVLKEMSGRRGGDLSGGQQQQLAIGRALTGDPRVLLLDEPTEGIQPNIIQQIGDVLRRLVKEMDMTIVLVEQYLDFVREIGHQTYVMSHGKVVDQCAADQISAEIVRRHLSV